MANNAAQFVVDTYKADLGGLPKTDALLYWSAKIQSGEMTQDEVKAAIQGSPEGIAYAETGEVDPDRAAVTGTPADFADEDGGADKPENGKNPQEVTAEQVQAIYQDELGRAGADNFIQGWVDSGMTEDEIRQAVSDSAEGQYYEQVGDTLGAATGLESLEVTPEAVSKLYQANLGRPGQQEYIMNWVNSGMSLAEIERAIMDSPEGQNFAVTGQPVGGLDELNTLIDQRAGESGTTNTGNFNPLIQQYYQELFNRQAQQPGLDYFAGRLGSGDLTEDTLRDAIIAGAQGSDRLYYDASQSGGPVFDATQALFGRRPARGRFNPETGQLEGGFGQYRSQLDAGELTPEQLRGRLVQLAYNRGEGGGQSGDYQNYLNTLGIDRSGNPFLQDDGTYANIAYGADLSQYRPDPGMPPPPPGGGGMPPMPPGFPGGGMPGKGGGMGRIPGQYITGNQLYSGLPYGMTQPMGMMNFMQPMMQPMIYQPPQMSEQYMPNRGLMSGYSTGFGPYGGYRRPYGFGGGKGGPRIMRPMGGKGGFGGGFGF